MLKKVFVLLTRFSDAGSKLFGFFANSYYTHASIGLEEDPNTFYSFVCKGFIVEKITRYLKPDKDPFPCKLYEIEVSEKVYNAIKKYLNGYIENSSFMRYTRLGLMLSLMHIPYKKKYRYFCSQFVADILDYGQAIELEKNSALYLPEDLGKLRGIKLCFQGNLRCMLKHFGIKPNFA